MFEEFAPHIPVARLLFCGGFGDAVGCDKACASNDIHEIKFLGGCLMWNDAAVCGDSILLKFILSVCYDMWKSRERESAMMFSVPLMCCKYRYVSLLMKVYPS